MVLPRSPKVIFASASASHATIYLHRRRTSSYTARFSKWPPSERYAYLEVSVVDASSSFSRYNREHSGPPSGLLRFNGKSLFSYRELGSHQPRRTSNTVIRNAKGGDVW